MPNKIVDLDIEAVASVDKAANKRKFLIIKRNDEDEELEGLIDGINTITKIGRPINGKRLNRLQELLGKFQQFMDEVLPRKVKKEERMELTEKLDAIEDEDVKKHFTELQEKADNADELDAKVEELTKQVEELTKEEEPEKEDITKGASPELIAKMAELEKETKEAKETADEEREIRKSKEYSDEASKLDKISDTDTLAKVQRLADENDLGEEFRTLTKAVNEQINVTEEFGKSQTLDDSSATFKLDMLAKNYAKDNNVTEAKGYSEVIKTQEGIELWEQANNEKEVN